MSTVISNLYVAITSCQKLKTHHALIHSKTSLPWKILFKKLFESILSFYADVTSCIK